MNAPPEPPGPGLCWVCHEEYVQQQLAIMVAQLDEHIAAEPDLEWREMMWRLRPKAIIELERVVRTACHMGTEH